jgi:DUF1680 family protein
VTLTVTPSAASDFELRLRIPGWCDAQGVRAALNGEKGEGLIENGYLVFSLRQWKAGDRVELSLPMSIQREKADPRVKADVGRVALQRGPVVYCAEAVDNGGKVSQLRAKPDTKYTAEFRPAMLGGVNVIKGDDGLLAIPYYAWDHREPGEMAVWLPER